MILGSTMALNFIYISFFSPNLITNVEGLITCSFLGNVFILSEATNVDFLDELNGEKKRDKTSIS